MNIYFSGIGGVGLGPLAQMAIDAGHQVTGSDLQQSLTTKELSEQGVHIQIGEQTGDYLYTQHQKQPFDWFVYTAALRDDHPELVAARTLGINSTKRDGLLAKIIDTSGQKLIAIAGTHGKTTTTGMMVWVLEQLGISVSYSVGSQLGFGPSGKFDPQADYFIYECDEFDRNFLRFHPYISIITSIDYDHPDTYPTESDYKEAFRQFVAQSHSTTLWQLDADYIELVPSETTCILQTHDVLSSSIEIAGEHNRRNATLIAKTLEHLPVNGSDKKIAAELSDILAALKSFPGTKRRFEKLADNLYSDYGHHPAEIAATLQMARELSEYVVLVYQPHQNIRQHEIRNQYTGEIFENADKIYWLPTYLSREDPNLETLTPAQLTANLSPESLHIVDFSPELWNEITHHRNTGHLVLCMGAGSIDSWLREELS